MVSRLKIELDKNISTFLKEFREASQIDFVHEKRHMDVFLEHPPPFS